MLMKFETIVLIIAPESSLRGTHINFMLVVIKDVRAEEINEGAEIKVIPIPV